MQPSPFSFSLYTKYDDDDTFIEEAVAGHFNARSHHHLVLLMFMSIKLCCSLYLHLSFCYPPLYIPPPPPLPLPALYIISLCLSPSLSSLLHVILSPLSPLTLSLPLFIISLSVSAVFAVTQLSGCQF